MVERKKDVETIVAARLVTLRRAARRVSVTALPVGRSDRGVVDIRGRRDFSRFDPSPGDVPL